MKIFRIYKIVEEYLYGNEYEYIERDKTIKYVDSLEKVKEYLTDIENKNNECIQCYWCPIISLTKRQYDNGKHEDVKSYCDKKDIVFYGNRITCNNAKHMDYTEYGYEEIEVE